MCLAIPGRIEEIRGESLLERTGKIDFGGARKEVCLAYVPEANVGDYVIVHAGFAISVLDEEEARLTLEDFRRIAELYEELEGDEVH